MNCNNLFFWNVYTNNEDINVYIPITKGGQLDAEAFSFLSSIYSVVALHNRITRPTEYSLEELTKWDSSFTNLLQIKRDLWQITNDVEIDSYTLESSSLFNAIISNWDRSLHLAGLYDSVYRILSTDNIDIKLNPSIEEEVRRIQAVIEAAPDNTREINRLKKALFFNIIDDYYEIQIVYYIANIESIASKILDYRYEETTVAIMNYGSIETSITSLLSKINNELCNIERSITRNIIANQQCDKLTQKARSIISLLSQYRGYNRFTDDNKNGCYALHDTGHSLFFTLSGTNDNHSLINIAKAIQPAHYVTMSDDVRYYLDNVNYITWKQSKDYDDINCIKEYHSRLFSCCERKLLAPIGYPTSKAGIICVKFTPCYICKIVENRGSIPFIPLINQIDKSAKYKTNDVEYVNKVMGK